MSLEKKSRKEIDTDIKKRGHDMTKRLEGSRKDVKDKKVTQDIAKSIKLSVTTEGIEQIKKGIKGAAKDIDKSFEHKDKAIKKEVFDTGKKTEKELKARVQDTRTDIAKMKSAISKLDSKSAKAHVDVAAKGGAQDMQFLNQQEKRQETGRKRGESELKKQGQQLKGATISFKK